MFPQTSTQLPQPAPTLSQATGVHRTRSCSRALFCESLLYPIPHNWLTSQGLKLRRLLLHCLYSSDTQIPSRCWFSSVNRARLYPDWEAQVAVRSSECRGAVLVVAYPFFADCPLLRALSSVLFLPHLRISTRRFAPDTRTYVG